MLDDTQKEGKKKKKKKKKKKSLEFYLHSRFAQIQNDFNVKSTCLGLFYA